MNNLKDILNRVIEAPLVFPPSATGNEPKHSWKDPGTHYYIDFSGIFTRTKTGKHRYRPMMYGKFELQKTRKHFIEVISEEKYKKLSDTEKQVYRKAVYLSFHCPSRGIPTMNWIDLDDAIEYNLLQVRNACK